MRSSSVLGLGLAALVMAGGASAAPTTSYFQAGPWTAFSGRTDHGGLICGVRTGNPSDGRQFTIESVIGQPGLRFIAFRPTWDIPKGTAIPILMTIAGQVPWTMQGEGAGHDVTWTLEQSGTATFLPAFRAGSMLRVSFPSGTEPPWQMVLSGSNEIGGTLLRCVQDYSARASGAAPAPAQAEAAPSQPGTPTQPFGAPVTQPFTPPVSSAPLATPNAASPSPNLPPLPALPPATHPSSQ